MSYASFTNIRKAIRERIEGTLTSLRDVAVGRLDGDMFINMPDEEKKRRALVTPRYDVRFVNFLPHEGRTMINSSQGLIRVELEIFAVYKLANGALPDDARDAVRATAEQDVDILRQALTHPDNIDDTSASAATGLVSGRLVWDGASLEREDWGEGGEELEGLLEMTHRYHGDVEVTQAIT